MQFLLWILVGAFAGWLTGKNMRRYGYGPLIDIAMGATGAAAAGFMMGSPAFPDNLGVITTLLASALGAVLLTGLMAFASGRRRYAWAGEAVQPGRRATRRGQRTLSQPEDDTLY